MKTGNIKLVSKIYPETDGTTAIQFCKADGSTGVMTLDTTNSLMTANLSTSSTAVTQTVGDNTTKIATTAFVLANAPSGTFNITYAGHGLSVGALSPVVPIARVGSSYSKACADSAANVEMVGVAIEAVDASTLKIQQIGTITRTAHGYTGPAIWLSATTAGALTETAPTTAGQFLKPVAKVIDANTLEIIDYPATQISAAGTYSTTFTSADSRISAGVLTVTHGLNQRPLFVTMMNGEGSPVDVYPGVTYSSTNAFTVDLSSFTITGTWTLIASKGAGAAVAGGGMWELVERYTVTGSAVMSKTFSGLNGDLDRRYKIVARIKNATGSGVHLRCHYGYNNGTIDNTRGNYHNVVIDGNTNGVSPLSLSEDYGVVITYTVPSLYSWGTVEIDAKTGMPRNATSHGGRSGSAGSINAQTLCSSLWTNTSNNITDIYCYIEQSTNAIDIGSVIELWKLAQ